MASRFTLRTLARKSGDLPSEKPRASDDLADWLQEVAKRPWSSDPLSTPPAMPADFVPTAIVPKVIPMQLLGSYVPHFRDMAGLTGLTIGCLQYYFLDVMVQIYALPKLVFFVPLGAS